MTLRPRLTLALNAVAIVALGGCAVPKMPGSDAPAKPAASAESRPTSTATLPEPNTAAPNASTAVQLTSFSIDGRVMPTVRGQQLLETRADMRRTDSVVGLDNRFLNSMVGDTRTAEIVRLDKKLVWTLNPPKQTYKECPLLGCNPPKQPTPEKPRKPEQQTEPSESSCPLTLKRNDFKVQATGERKTINAFNTERFQINWTVEVTDKQKRSTVNSVLLDMWTTPETGAIRDVHSIQETFQKRWLAAIGASDHPFGRYVPRDVMASMGALMRTPGSTKGMAAWAGEMKKVRGYPILLTLSWSAEGNACSDDTQASASESKRSVPTSASGFLGNLVGDMVQDKAKDMAKSATTGTLLTYTYEVKTIEVKPVSDSSFVPEPSYTRVP
jgi:hypothetical protein